MNEQAVTDNNMRPALLLHSADGLNTVKAKAGSGGGFSVEGGAADNTPAVGSPMIVGGQYNLVPPTYDSGDAARFQTDANGNQRVTEATAFDEDIDAIAAYSKEITYTYITADAVVSAVPVGYCGYICEASATLVLSVYDNASAASGRAFPLSKALVANDIMQLDTPISFVNGVYADVVSGTGGVWVLTRKRLAA